MSRQLTVGLVGCGINSDKHLSCLYRLGNARLVAICDIDFQRARDKARKYGVKIVPKDYDSMLGLDLDLIDIVTPTQTHSELATLALETGHNVLVEKPMAVNSKECLGMIRSARKHGRFICPVHNKRFYKSVTETKSIMMRDRLSPNRMSVLHLYPRSGTGPVPKWIVTEEYGGILWESMVHDVYLAEYLLGNIRSAMAFANKLGERVFDSLTLVLQEDRKVAVCQTEWAAREPVETIDVLTMEGDRFMIDLPHDLLLRRSRRYQGRRTTILRTMFDDLYDPALKWSRHLGRILRMGSYTNALPFERTFATVINQYLSFLAGATPTLPVPPEEGLRSIMVLEAARRSIKTGRPQPVKQII